MKVALKELRETMVWLKIITRKSMIGPTISTAATDECNQLISIFVKSIQTADRNPKP